MAKKIDEFVQHILDQLSPIGAVSARSMFGGWMLSLDGDALGMVNDGVLYLKVDDEVRPAFTEAGGEPFGYFHKSRGTTVYMQGYSTIPEGDIDDRHAFLMWARLAAGASRRAAAQKTGAKTAAMKTAAKKAAAKTKATRTTTARGQPANKAVPQKTAPKTATKKTATKKTAAKKTATKKTATKKTATKKTAAKKTATKKTAAKKTAR